MVGIKSATLDLKDASQSRKIDRFLRFYKKNIVGVLRL